MNLTVAEKRKSIATLPPKNGKKEIFYPESDGQPMGETAFHVTVILSLFQTLGTFFNQQNDVVVIADMMFYYEEGNPRKVIAPDVMVVRGVGKHLRRTFKLWEEKIPEVVFEISSRGTWKEDFQKKFILYQELGVKEYYIFDPEYDYLAEPLVAYHLKEEEFKEIKVKRGKVFSPVLGLEIVDTGKTLRLFNPETKNFLPTMEDLTKQASKVGRLESEIEKLKAEVAKLKRQK